MEGVVCWYNQIYDFGCLSLKDCYDSSDTYYFNSSNFSDIVLSKKEQIKSSSIVRFEKDLNNIILLDIL